VSLLTASKPSLAVVGIADMKVSGCLEDVVVTYALGSCLGVCIYDPVAQVGGILHAMLPKGTASPERAQSNPARFVDTGLPLLFKGAYALGAEKARTIVYAVGGAHMGPVDQPDNFRIGERNFVELKRMLWRNCVVLHDQDVGGNVSRTVSLSIATGAVSIKSGSDLYTLKRCFPRRAKGQGQDQ